MIPYMVTVIFVGFLPLGSLRIKEIPLVAYFCLYQCKEGSTSLLYTIFILFACHFESVLRHMVICESKESFVCFLNS